MNILIGFFCPLCDYLLLYMLIALVVTQNLSKVCLFKMQVRIADIFAQSIVCFVEAGKVVFYSKKDCDI